MYVDDDEGHTDNKDVDENEKPNADKDDYDDKVEKEAEERLAAAAAAEEGEGSGPPPPKVQARHAKKLAYILPRKIKTLQICNKNSVKTKTPKFRVKRQKLSERRPSDLWKFHKKKSFPYCFKWLQKVEEANTDNETDKEAKASSVLFSLNFASKIVLKVLT